MLGDVRSSWTGRVRVGLALTSLLGLAVAAAGPAGPGQTSASRPNERRIFVSVLDKNGAPVSGLTAADFVVREDGISREVIRAERATGPITFALLIDNSQSATRYMADLRRSLKVFVDRMGGKNPIAIIAFGERPSVITDYTLDIPSLETGVDRLFATAGSGSYLLEAVDDACKGLAKRDFDRAVVLAITAGGPEFSNSPYDVYLPRLRESGAMFDVMAFVVSPPNPTDYGQRNRETFLDAATRASGGDRFNLLTSMALDSELDRLINELANQYWVSYGRPDALMPAEKIQVSVRRPGLTARGTAVKPRKG